MVTVYSCSSVFPKTYWKAPASAGILYIQCIYMYMYMYIHVHVHVFMCTL